MDKSKVTIYDVADRAGVAISTVSRVLNDSHEVSDETKAKVEAAIKALQFRPDRTAKMLAQRQTGWLTVAVPSSTSQVYNELLKGIKDCLRKYDIDMLLCNMGSSAPKKTLLRFLDRGAVDALLLASLPTDPELTVELKALHAPVVLVGTQSAEFDSIVWDNQAGGVAAVQHLIDSGHTRIGMITPHTMDSELSDRQVATDLYNGYKIALERAGLPFDPALVQSGRTTKHAGFSEEAGFEAMQTLLDEDPGLSAVFASSDVQALGAWKALREAGRSVPEDVALVGYNNIKVSEYIGLSSVDQELLKYGYTATEMLLKHRKKGSQPPTSVQVTPQLRVRASSNFVRA